MKRKDLIEAIDRAQRTFKALMVNYPGLEGYLVFSSHRGQINLTDDALQILQVFPAMISESEAKNRAIEQLATMEGLKEELQRPALGKKAGIEKAITAAGERMKNNLQHVQFEEDTCIEIRFKPGTSDSTVPMDPKLSILDRIFEMQKDPLVSQVHTPQTRASIRIVIGTLAELAHGAAGNIIE